MVTDNMVPCVLRKLYGLLAVMGRRPHILSSADLHLWRIKSDRVRWRILTQNRDVIMTYFISTVRLYTDYSSIKLAKSSPQEGLEWRCAHRSWLTCRSLLLLPWYLLFSSCLKRCLWHYARGSSEECLDGGEECREILNEPATRD